ncbi:hypothetical protein [Ureibacillus terrenus]|nr:hypothetical protein [Ureibacillus terrenus]MED3661223.1 hypothetical protein [Ureibacillus terrenus]MED3764302.1 hypothetical protein [Ureibacillus terrenus]
MNLPAWISIVLPFIGYTSKWTAFSIAGSTAFLMGTSGKDGKQKSH